MKRLLTILWLTASIAQAQDQSTPNLITSGTTHTWTGVATGADPNNCCTGGPVPLYDPATNIIHFSYGQGTAAQTFGINEALRNAGSGIQVTGYSYSWDIQNNNKGSTQNGVDSLTANVLTYNYDNSAVRRTDTWTYNTRFDWTTFSGNVNYENPGLPSEFGNLSVQFTSRDAGFWAGYYGPKVRNVSLKMNYGVDQCVSDPLSSPNCPGYAAAYQNQQCTANALFSPSCPGYAAAFFTQQCTQNQLYSPQCPGYTTAYATKMLLEKQGIAEVVDTAGTIAANDPVKTVTEESTDKVQAAPVVEATALVPMKPDTSTATAAVTAPAPAPVAAPKQEQKQDGPKTSRQELQEKRQAAAKREAVAKGKELAKEMGNAKSMEQQAAAQGAVLATMGYSPGFESYGKSFVPDAAGYRPYSVYNNQKTIDNRKLGWGLFGPTDKVHSEMVESQYKGN